MKVFSVEQMRRLDELTIQQAGIPAIVLMERAGIGAGECILEYLQTFDSVHVKRLVIVCGSGNNGGDGLVIAKYLWEKTGWDILIYSTTPLDQLKSEAARTHAGLLPEKVTIKVTDGDIELKKGDIIIDCLLGTGFKGIPKMPYDGLIRQINQANLPVISIDIPSGLDGNTGVGGELAVEADLTIAIGFPKIGFFKGNGIEHCGQLRCVDIGIPEQYVEIESTAMETVFRQDVAMILNKTPLESHKNSRGAVLVIGGSRLYHGAPILSGTAALRSGAGLCRVVVPFEYCHQPLALILNPSCVNDGYLTEKAFDEMIPFINCSDSIVIGPGMGRHPETAQFLKKMLELPELLILDADALNLISENPSIYRCKGIRIMTPHPGEMQRLLRGFEMDECLELERHQQAVKLAQLTGAYVVLKGFHTVIAAPDGRYRVNTSGNSNLATAGSGDSLTGIIGALVNQIDEPFDAVTAAVFAHGLAGELSPNGHGTIGDDLLNLLPGTLKKISKWF